MHCGDRKKALNHSELKSRKNITYFNNMTFPSDTQGNLKELSIMYRIVLSWRENIFMVIFSRILYLTEKQ